MNEEWKQVVALNNAGTHHFFAENFPEAISFFEKAVIEAKATLLKYQSNTSPKAFNRTDPHAQGEDCEESKIQLELRDRDDCSSLDNDENLVSRCCIWISESTEGPFSMQDCTTFAMSSVYNLGVTYHLVGLHQGSRPFLEKANRYYGLASQLFSQVQLRCDGSRLSMHLLNNWATLHRSLGDQFMSRQLLRQLFCLVSHHVDLGWVSAEGHHQSNLFLRNLLVLLYPPHTAGAA
ncbi:unnamed protein product [Cylindrotheca closterium]|uniref:Uncharacterized protein n=1 Tax=Cylindrotheca closterium TaxID=2856 RepID=A0AAD2G2J0_9STRA|nr:unnamed protein product [Cylindrotheca closterium]